MRKSCLYSFISGWFYFIYFVGSDVINAGKETATLFPGASVFGAHSLVALLTV